MLSILFRLMGSGYTFPARVCFLSGHLTPFGVYLPRINDRFTPVPSLLQGQIQSWHDAVNSTVDEAAGAVDISDVICRARGGVTVVVGRPQPPPPRAGTPDIGALCPGIRGGVFHPCNAAAGTGGAEATAESVAFVCYFRIAQQKYLVACIIAYIIIIEIIAKIFL